MNSLNNIIIAGDLNIVMNVKEKRGGRSSKDKMIHVVEDIMLHWDLMDFNQRNGYILGPTTGQGMITSWPDWTFFSTKQYFDANKAHFHNHSSQTHLRSQTHPSLAGRGRKFGTHPLQI